jgi:hypothetical protein
MEYTYYFIIIFFSVFSSRLSYFDSELIAFAYFVLSNLQGIQTEHIVFCKLSLCIAISRLLMVLSCRCPGTSNYTCIISILVPQDKFKNHIRMSSLYSESLICTS